MTSPDLALVESRTLRDQYVSNIEVLDKVGVLNLLPGGFHATTEMVAAYFEVTVSTVKSAVNAHRPEVETDGYRSVEGEELRTFKKLCGAQGLDSNLSGIGPRTRSLALFPKQAILRMGMLLKKSDVARQVRDYLIAAEKASRTPSAVELDELEAAERYVQAIKEKRAALDRAAAAEAIAAQQAKQIEAVAPLVAEAEQHRAADGLMAVADFANKLKAWAGRTHGTKVKVKHDDVWNFLADIGLLIRGNTVRHNHPTALAVERDFVRVKTTEYTTNNHGMKATHTPRLTPAGEGWAWDRALKRINAHGSLTKPTKAIEGEVAA